MQTFTIIWLGQLISTIGSRMTIFAVTIWAWELTGSATALALMGFFFLAPSVAIAILEWTKQMLKSDEATIENGQLKWLTDEPKPSSARVIVTILEDVTPLPKHRTPPTSIAGKGKTLGDLVSPTISERDWKCLKNLRSH